MDPFSGDTERIHFFTAEGTVVTLPGRRLKEREATTKRPTTTPKLPSWEEQGLCVGSIFLLSATNGHDFGRRFLALGFCQCTETLSEVVELTVVGRGGTVMLREVDQKGFSRRLDMSVAVPSLWGVPPELDYLHGALQEGGGIVHRVWREYIM